MLNERNFRKIIMGLTLFTILVVFFTTYRYYKNLPKLDEVAQNKINIENSKGSLSIQPFEAFSMKKQDLMIKLGKGDEGSGSDYDNMYIDYRQEWFSKYVNSRYYYGDYKRVYQIVLDYPSSDSKTIYENMKKTLGQPLYDGIYGKNDDETRNEGEQITYWLKDSVRYTMENIEEEKKCLVTMNLQYFANVEGYEMGQRPTEIQRVNGTKLGNSSIYGNVILIGDKPEYTTTYYEKLFLVFGNSEKTYMGKFDNEFNGGYYPQIQVLDIDKDGENEAIIKADNEYQVVYTVFEYDNGKLNVSYASDKNPLEDDNYSKEKKEVSISKENEKEIISSQYGSEENQDQIDTEE